MLHKQLADKRYEPLTKEEERQLSQDLLSCKTEAARNKIIRILILRHLRLVYAIAKQYNKLPLEEAFNVGVLALTEAMHRWQPSPTSMNAYQWAKRYITTALNKATDNARPIRLPEQVAYQAALNTKTIAMKEYELRRPLTNREKSTIGVSLQDLPTVSNSLDAPSNLDDMTTIGESLADSYDLEADVQHRETLNTLSISLNALTNIERTVIEARFGLGQTEQKTLAQLGKILKMSGEQVRKIEATAIAKLQHPAKKHKHIEEQ